MLKNHKNIIYKKLLYLLPQYNKFVTISNMGHYGRLGNQLFQYAAIRSYSNKHNVPILLPESTENRMGNFNITYRQFVKRHILQAVKMEKFEEIQFHFDPNFFLYYKRKDFTGYFQTEKYFVDIRDILLKEFTLKNNQKNDYCLKYIEKIRSENPGKSIVALHNRRGDYLYTALSPLLTIEYIEKAKSYFKDAVFIVCSDNKKDIEWCKENITGKNHYYSEGHDDLTDITLMRYCDHNIISNSSFSWWAAWLNENPNKVVIAPNKWFNKAELNTADLIPDKWIRI